MYDELVKRLRSEAECPDNYPEDSVLMREAADAIEELSRRVAATPHGDLIDRREAIIDANERAYDFWLSDDEVNATIRFLNEQTTIIKAEDNNAIP